MPSLLPSPWARAFSRPLCPGMLAVLGFCFVLPLAVAAAASFARLPFLVVVLLLQLSAELLVGGDEVFLAVAHVGLFTGAGADFLHHHLVARVLPAKMCLLESVN
jgi:hypothetical protein